MRTKNGANKNIRMTRRYCFICHIVFVYASPLSGRFLFSRDPSNPWFLRQNTCFLRRYSVLTGILRAVPRVVRSRGEGVPMWLWGVCIFVRGITRDCSLTCYPDPQFRFPVHFLFPQGTGEPSSVDHL